MTRTVSAKQSNLNYQKYHQPHIPEDISDSNVYIQWRGEVGIAEIGDKDTGETYHTVHTRDSEVLAALARPHIRYTQFDRSNHGWTTPEQMPK